MVFCSCVLSYIGFLGGSDGKVSACSAGDPGSIPGLGRYPGEGNGNPLQYSCLENSMDWEAPQSLVGYTLWGCKDSDMTERLHFTWKIVENIGTWQAALHGVTKSRIQLSDFSSVHFSRSVVSDFWNTMNARPPVHHQLLESTQTHVY